MRVIPATPRVGVFLLVAFTVLVLTQLAGRKALQRPGIAAAQAPEQGYRVDPLRGPVDLGLTDPALVGAIDIHAHLQPGSPSNVACVDLYSRLIRTPPPQELPT